jgi:hypothetical protein
MSYSLTEKKNNFMKPAQQKLSWKTDIYECINWAFLWRGEAKLCRNSVLRSRSWLTNLLWGKKITFFLKISVHSLLWWIDWKVRGSNSGREKENILQNRPEWFWGSPSLQFCGYQCSVTCVQRQMSGAKPLRPLLAFVVWTGASWCFSVSHVCWCQGFWSPVKCSGPLYRRRDSHTLYFLENLLHCILPRQVISTRWRTMIQCLKN